ncbi:unnamed protein product [Closterium sp. NIES-64]|nr:unnamed protein product [Closterium sp. NIES-64]
MDLIVSTRQRMPIHQHRRVDVYQAGTDQVGGRAKVVTAGTEGTLALQGSELHHPAGGGAGAEAIEALDGAGGNKSGGGHSGHGVSSA